jgi:Cdc6-like AAA superfamily ATPase
VHKSQSAFEGIFNDVRRSEMKYPEQHYMLFGDKGVGRTMLLIHLTSAVEDDERLSKWLIPVLFNEEQHDIRELVNIWEYIAIYLEDRYDFPDLYGEIKQFAGDEDYEATAFDILVSHLDKRKKKLILFVDNASDLLKRFSELEIFRLREILQTKSHLRFIGASSYILEDLLDYRKPFYEFFRMIRL